MCADKQIIVLIIFVVSVFKIKDVMSLSLLVADCKNALTSLTVLSNDELDDILNDEEKIQDILNSTDQNYLKDIENEKETVTASNSSLVEFNLAREPDLVEGRRRIEELSAQGEELTKTVEDKSKELRDKVGDVSLETTLALLETAASEMEEESDALVKQLLENEVELEDFLDKFLIKRKLMHLRLVKAEKMAKILSQDLSSGNIPNYVNSPPLSLNTNYFPVINNVPNVVPSAGVPYPIGPVSMPMPGNANYFQRHF